MSNNTKLATAPQTATNYILKATSTTLGNSLAYDDGTGVAIGDTTASGYKFKVNGTLNVTGAATFSSSVTAGSNILINNSGTTIPNIGATSAQGGLNLYSGATADYNGGGLITLVSSDRSGAYTRGEIYISAGRATNNTANGFIALSTSDTERMRITSAGNVGIGTSSPSSFFEAVGTTVDTNLAFFTTTAATNRMLIITRNTSNNAQIDIRSHGATYSETILGNSMSNAVGVVGSPQSGAAMVVGPTTSSPLVFGTSNSERMRITSGGYLKASNNGSYQYAANNFHELNQSAADWIQVSVNKISSGTPLGFFIGYPNISPNNTGSPFFQCDDSVSTRFRVRSNGGIENFQANNVNLSDERTKKDIIPLESYWDKFKAIEIVKFKYKDQTHDDFNIGVIAQQVESVAPEFIDIDGFGDTPEDGIPLKTVYTSDLHHATIKVLQEAMAKIETLETELTELKSLIAAK